VPSYSAAPGRPSNPSYSSRPARSPPRVVAI
jgi:hypothetical protein